ncbi:MAG: ABC-2 transporter permease [Propionibacteriaceae bacterium]|nr:ABC-2 transporter permease [Propionibacteriaceae bacterium]
MRRIWNATKLDFYTGRSYLIMGAAVGLVLAGAIGLVAKIPEIGMILMIVLAVFFGGYVFSMHERNHSDRLYGLLPLRKSEMIIGRYLYTLIIGVAATVASGLMGWIISRVQGSPMDPVVFWGVLAVAFLYYFFATGIAFPIYFKFTFSKAYIFTMVPLYIVMLLGMLLVRNNVKNGIQNAISLIQQVQSFFTDNFYLIPLIGILGSAVFLVVSGVVSTVIYTRKEI